MHVLARQVRSLAGIAAICCFPAAVRAETTLSTLYAFPNDGLSPNGYSRGAVPTGDMMQGADGNFYGTTVYGGSSTCNDGYVVGCGAIFTLTPAGTQTVLYAFTYDSTTGTAVNGGWPSAGLVQGPDGYFYGVASAFGDKTALCNTTGGCGTIFKVSSTGKFKLLYTFRGLTADCKLMDGGQPRGRLLLARDGYFYGTTNQGGCGSGGTVFRISSTGAYTQLHVFQGNNNMSDGANPVAGLIQATDGYLFGTTSFGGQFGYGTVFRMSTSGAIKVLHSFAHSSATGTAAGGSQPLGSLVQASDGNLYGTTSQDGAGSAGTLFRITTAGTFTTLYDFTLNGSYTGIFPRAGLIQATDGKLYGTTWRGGIDNDGTVFSATLAGAVTEAASFTGDNGRNPVAGVYQAADGTLVGTASGLGSGNGGTIVQANLGLLAPVPSLARFTPSSGMAGTSVRLSGAGFVGAKKVTFNGTAATFSVTSATSIRATVPAGATTGPITVTSPAGSGMSKTKFTIP